MIVKEIIYFDRPGPQNTEAVAEAVKNRCEELGISVRQLARWRDEFRLLGNDAFPGQGHNRDEEVVRLKRELAKVRQERDFLKGAVVFFAKESK